jgi:iron(III) transport system ATP-binding protein
LVQRAAVGDFFGDAVLLPAEVHDGRVRCALGDLPVRNDIVEGVAQLPVRPGQLHLHATTHESGVDAVVKDVSYYGRDASARLTLLPGGPVVAVRLLGADLPLPGTPTRLTVTGDTLVFPRGPPKGEY